jgi:hypothetical protein
MAQTKHPSEKGGYLSQTIPGYKGYTSTRTARQTDQVFSDEVLEKLSETVAMVARLKRLAGASINPDVLPSLDVITDSADRLAAYIAETVATDDMLLSSLENGKADEIVAIDSEIIEKVGSINQALSMMDLEAGVGITAEDIDSICELLDDLGDCLRKRSILLGG